MITRQHRFHGRGSLNYVYRKGRQIRGGSLSLRYAPSKRPDYRLAVVVSRKVSKSAVVRNRIRRRIYEIVRIERAGAKPWPVDLVLTVFDDTPATASHDALRQNVLDLLEKAAH